MKRALLGVLSCVMSLTACAGTETGNPSFDGTLSYNAYTSNAQSVALLEGEDSAIVVDNAWLALGDVGFSTACDSGAASEGHVDGLGIGDHAPEGPATTPMSLAEGEYCGVHLAFELTDVMTTDVPAELTGNSVLLRGTLADGRPFQLTSAFEGDVFLASDAPFALDAEQPDVLVGFDVATWLSALPWNGATADDEGLVIVDSTSNTDVLDAFELAIARGTALFRDTNAGQVTSSSVKLADGAR